MTKIRTKTLYKDAIDQAFDLAKNPSKGPEYFRLKAVAALKNNAVGAVSKTFGVTPETLRRWTGKFAEFGLEGLKNKVKNPRQRLLSEVHENFLKKRLETHPESTLKSLCLDLKENFQISITQVGLWKNLKRLGYSHISSRPCHYKQDKSKVDAFKKNS